MTDDPKDEAYTVAEAEARAEATLKRMLATPHKPHKSKMGGAAAKAKREQ